MGGGKRMKQLSWAIFFIVIVGAGAIEARRDEWDDLDEPVQAVTPETFPTTINAADERPRPETGSRGVLPYSMLVFLGASLVVAIAGGRANAKRMVAFEECFCKEPDGLLRKHFTRLGKKPGTLLVNESSSTCKLHANGHQYLDGAVITLTMLRRHELVSYIAQWVSQQEDIICLEMYVKEGSMPPMVLAIASASTHKELARNHKDVKLLAQRMEVKEEKIRDWPSKDLMVYAEHPSYFYDMMTKPMLTQVFGGVAFPRHQRYFRGLQISSDSNSSHRKVVRCWIALPPPEQMSEVGMLMQAALAMVNQVGNYSISPDRQKQAEQARLEFNRQTGQKKDAANPLAKEMTDGRSKAKRR